MVKFGLRCQEGYRLSAVGFRCSFLSRKPIAIMSDRIFENTKLGLLNDRKLPDELAEVGRIYVKNVQPRRYFEIVFRP